MGKNNRMFSMCRGLGSFQENRLGDGLHRSRLSDRSRLHRQDRQNLRFDDARTNSGAREGKKWLAYMNGRLFSAQQSSLSRSDLLVQNIQQVGIQYPEVQEAF